ncbi:MAG: NFACT family protein [Candidatus Thermoplasmatota archaeon]|nr:NFACT family protein [Candidatus Thermoplasmatota archaeon]
MHRELSSFDIYVIVKELQQYTGSFIEKIFQLNWNELIIRLKNPATKIRETLFIRNGELICITKKQFDVPLKPKTFTLTSRKNLINSKISNFNQLGFDRIIDLCILKKQEEYHLIIEFFSNGNIILTDSKKMILIPLINQKWAHRTIARNVEYLPPPVQINPFNLSYSDFMDLLNESKADLVRTLAVKVNLGGVYAEELCKRCQIQKNIKISELKKEDLNKIYEKFVELLKIFKDEKFNPIIIKKDGLIQNILPIDFVSYESKDVERSKSFLKSLEALIDTKIAPDKNHSKPVNEIGKLGRQLLQQQQAVKDLQVKIENKKMEGDVIYLNISVCEELLNEIRNTIKLKDKKGKLEEIKNKEIVKEFDPQDNLLTVSLPDINGISHEINLDFRKTAAENAEMAYRSSKKLRLKLEGAIESIEKTKILVKNSEKNLTTKIAKNEVTSRKFWFESYRWFISSDGNLVIGGKDAKSNEKVVKKHLKVGDRYVHADIQGAPSCVVKKRDVNDNEMEISEKTLEEACIFSACYSKAWKQFTESQAYWVYPEQVSKTPQSGEFVKKGAFIIRGTRNYRKVKLELVIGEVQIGGEIKIMGGPLESIKNRSDKYVVIVPGKTSKSEMAYSLGKLFNVDVSLIERTLPPGGSSVINFKGVKYEKGRK